MSAATYARKSTDQHGVSDEGGDTMKETKTIKVGIHVDEPRVRSQFEGEQRRTGWRVVRYDSVPGELAYTVTLERGED